ncbi:MAG: AglZ/HisF2 family acetamidino modification protein [Alishewanella aestuarii]
MLKHRVIPTLLLSGGGLVKTRKFANPSYVGDPINAIRIFNDKEVDELIVVDIEASKLGREPDYKLIEEFASECFMPLTYGGGVKTPEQAARLFSLGVEKVCIHSAALEDLNLISEFSGRFGAQSVAVSVDVRRNLFGSLRLYNAVNKKNCPENWLDYLQRVQLAGAGEILLNAVHKDGTLTGPDLEMIKAASVKLSIPLIAMGGVASLTDIKSVVESGADAVAAGAFFVYHGRHRAVLISYPKYHELELLFKGNK